MSNSDILCGNITEGPVAVSVDQVSREKALLVPGDRDGGQIIRESGAWSYECSYGCGRVLGSAKSLEEAGEALANHLGIKSPVVDVQKDPGYRSNR